jgi:hypothetical protein
LELLDDEEVVETEEGFEVDELLGLEVDDDREVELVVFEDDCVVDVLRLVDEGLEEVLDVDLVDNDSLEEVPIVEEVLEVEVELLEVR